MMCVRLPRLLEFKETGSGGGQVPSELLMWVSRLWNGSHCLLREACLCPEVSMISGSSCSTFRGEEICCSEWTQRADLLEGRGTELS